MKKVVSLLMAWVLCCGLLSACGASEPCKSCGSTPTKGYKMNTLRKLSIIVQTALLIAHSVLGQQQRTIPPR